MKIKKVKHWNISKKQLSTDKKQLESDGYKCKQKGRNLECIKKEE